MEGWWGAIASGGKENDVARLRVYMIVDVKETNMYEEEL